MWLVVWLNLCVFDRPFMRSLGLGVQSFVTRFVSGFNFAYVGSVGLDGGRLASFVCARQSAWTANKKT